VARVDLPVEGLGCLGPDSTDVASCARIVHLGPEPRPTRSRGLLHRYFHSPSSFTYTTHLRDPGRYSVDRPMD